MLVYVPVPLSLFGSNYVFFCVKTFVICILLGKSYLCMLQSICILSKCIQKTTSLVVLHYIIIHSCSENEIESFKLKTCFIYYIYHWHLVNETQSTPSTLLNVTSAWRVLNILLFTFYASVLYTTYVYIQMYTKNIHNFMKIINNG